MLARRTVIGAMALAISLAAPFGALAQQYPSGSVTLVVPYPPGGPTDAMGRLIAQELSTVLDAPVVACPRRVIHVEC